MSKAAFDGRNFILLLVVVEWCPEIILSRCLELPFPEHTYESDKRSTQFLQHTISKIR